MERIDTRSRTTRKAALLALALALAAVAIFFHASPGRPTADASPPPPAEAKAAVPEDEGLWLTVPKMARVRDLPVLTGPANDEGALAESTLRVEGTGVHTVFAGGDVASQTVAVTGCGPIGLMAVAICRAVGAARVLATDVSPYRLGLARRMGADAAVNVSEEAPKEAFGGEGVDVLLEISGNPKAIDQGLELLRLRGRAALLGLPSGEVGLKLSERVILKGVSLHGVFGRHIFETWYRGSDLLEKVDLSPVITHRFAMGAAEEATAMMRSGECGKVVLSPPGAVAG